ncbi:MAG: multidrug MFS transporter [Deltaproteobacteria bacterium HGW-Deltaproteobacteria-21]|nr:MAG: multidrug MFS transporter [Deltaproteobacteria bacterium HGW-Deltaproteobacteria-21]
MQTPRPFEIHVPDETLADLSMRLERTRWPDENQGEAWQYGSDLKYMKDLAGYWQTEYNWRAHEARLNNLRQFVTSVDGIDLHFIHEPGVGPDPMPLILMHGWPGSIVEFERLLPLLTDPGRFGGDPADAFTVVAPSLPGYAFSFRPGQPRFSVARMADIFAKLMTGVLGYDRFAAQGGDWGGYISAALGAAHADKVLGIHVNLLWGPRQDTPTPKTEEERAYMKELNHWLKEEQAYGLIQGTKPQTLAYGLTDSPVGLAAWIVEKFRTWSDCGGSVENRSSKDLLLTNVMLYWVTGAINSSFWPYWSRLHEPWPITRETPVRAPTAFASFPKEILHPPRAWVEPAYPNIRRWTMMTAGGHFPALEEPEALAADVRAFFRDLR